MDSYPKQQRRSGQGRSGRGWQKKRLRGSVNLATLTVLDLAVSLVGVVSLVTFLVLLLQRL